MVAFRTGGLPDIVEHKRTGYLAEPFHTQDLAAGISWAPARVAGLYAEVYGQVIERSAQKGTSTFSLR